MFKYSFGKLRAASGNRRVRVKMGDTAEHCCLVGPNFSRLTVIG